MQRDRIPLFEDKSIAVMKHLHHLWSFDVRLETMQDGSVASRYICDDESVREIPGNQDESNPGACRTWTVCLADFNALREKTVGLCPARMDEIDI